MIFELIRFHPSASRLNAGWANSLSVVSPSSVTEWVVGVQDSIRSVGTGLDVGVLGTGLSEPGTVPSGAGAAEGVGVGFSVSTGPATTGLEPTTIATMARTDAHKPMTEYRGEK